MTGVKKLAADTHEELYSYVRKAADADGRTMAGFIRMACYERAKTINAKTAEEPQK